MSWTDDALEELGLSRVPPKKSEAPDVSNVEGTRLLLSQILEAPMAISTRKTSTTHPPYTTSPKPPEIPAIILLRKGSCKSLEGRGTLDYELGHSDSKSLYWRISQNSGGGFFSNEWIPFSAIRSVLESRSADTPLTSLALRGLFKGKSANNPSFLLATLVAEGVVKALEGKRRQYTLADIPAFLQSVSQASHSKRGQGKTPAGQKKSRRMSGPTKPSSPRK